MGYLDNSSITVDAILTRKGRELLARNDGSFNITQFALGDDEIDYTLFNENHPNGTQYASEAIENMPLIEAIPDGSNIMRSKLITLSRGITSIPYIRISGFTSNAGPELAKGATITLTPTTYNISGNNQQSVESGGYTFTIVDNRLRESMSGTGMPAPQNPQARLGNFSTTAQSENVMGTSLSIVATLDDTLFTTDITTRTTSIIIEGNNTGVRLTIPFTVKSTL